MAEHPTISEKVPRSLMNIVRRNAETIRRTVITISVGQHNQQLNEELEVNDL
jgi:hypothetical protein